MSKPRIHPASDHDPVGWRSGANRVLANALLVLVVYELVTWVGLIAMILGGATVPEPPAPMVVWVTAFPLVRWIYVLPVMLPVLVGIEYVARRIPHARVMTAVVAFGPLVLWELTQSPGGFPSGQGVILGVVAVLFTVVARLPARSPGHANHGIGAAPPPAGSVVTPR